MDFVTFKEECKQEGIKMTSFESIMDFSQFKLNEQGLLPVIVQHYKTKDVLMLAYMNEEAFDKTIKTGKMTYYSRSRNALWVKGETSGHFKILNNSGFSSVSVRITHGISVTFITELRSRRCMKMISLVKSSMIC